jgi:hypothetical protein
MQSGCCELLRVGQAYENAPEVSCFVPAHIDCPILAVAFSCEHGSCKMLRSRVHDSPIVPEHRNILLV